MSAKVLYQSVCGLACSKQTLSLHVCTNNKLVLNQRIKNITPRYWIYAIMIFDLQWVYLQSLNNHLFGGSSVH